MKIIKRIGFKAKNRRVTIMVLQDNNGAIRFLVITRRLFDFKKREILEHEFWMTPETFLLVQDIINMAVDDDVVIKKLILDEIVSVKKSEVKCSIFKNKEFYVV